MFPENKLLTLCWLFAILILQVPTAGAAANIHGVVYEWDTFLPAENVVLEVNSTPPQSLVAKYGIYSFELEPGNYQIEATSYQNNTITHKATETITVTDDGDYVMDLLLTPQYSESFTETEPENTSSSSGSTDITSMLPYIAVIIAGLGLAGYFLQKRSSPGTGGKTAKSTVKSTSLSTSLPTDESTHLSTSLPTDESTHLSTSLPTSLSDTPGTRTPTKEIEPSERPGLDESELLESKTRPTEETDPQQTPKSKGTAEHIPDDTENTARADNNPLPTNPIKEKTDIVVEDKPILDPVSDPVPDTEPADLSDNNTETGEMEQEEDEIIEQEDSRPKTREDIKDLPADLQEVLEILIKNGGRMTQKEMRKHIRYSEGKVSMMIHDLERRGWLTKYKKGRGNIIILTDDILCMDNDAADEN